MFLATHTPPLSILLDGLLTRDQGKIARHLGVSQRTLQRWIEADDAPRAALLALFYETKWGHSAVHTHAANGETHWRGLAQSLERETATLHTRIERLERLGEGFGAANAPMWQVG